MPNIASAKKRMRQNEKRRARNKSRRGRLRTALRRLEDAIESGDRETVQERWKHAQSVLDRTAQAGVIHANKAARKKARLARRIQELSA